MINQLDKHRTHPQIACILPYTIPIRPMTYMAHIYIHTSYPFAFNGTESSATATCPTRRSWTWPFGVAGRDLIVITSLNHDFRISSRMDPTAPNNIWDSISFGCLDTFSDGIWSNEKRSGYCIMYDYVPIGTCIKPFTMIIWSYS